METLQQKILYRVVALETTKGHLKWKVSDLARLAKVSRPLVYYHFGKTKRAILLRCVELIAEEYFGFSEERRRMRSEGRLVESVLKPGGSTSRIPRWPFSTNGGGCSPPYCKIY